MEPGEYLGIAPGLVVVNGYRHKMLLDCFNQKRVPKNIVAEIHASRAARYFLKKQQEWQSLLDCHGQRYVEVAMPADIAKFAVFMEGYVYHGRNLVRVR